MGNQLDQGAGCSIQVPKHQIHPREPPEITRNALKHSLGTNLAIEHDIGSRSPNKWRRGVGGE